MPNQTWRNVLLALVALASLHAVIAQNNPQTHINIGTRPGDNSIVSMGQVAARYQPGSPTPTTVDKFFPWLDVFVTLVGGFNTTGLSQDFFASASNSNTTLETSTVDLVTAIGTVTPAVGASVRVRMACATSGQDTVTLQIDFTGFDSMLIAWSKKCQVTGPHTGFSIATTQWTPASGAAPDVVANGETAPLWTGNDVSGTFVLFNASTSQQTFYLWLTTGFQLWEVVGDQSDFDKIDIEISPTLGAAAPPALNSNSNVTIQFNCKVNAGAAFVSMSLTVDPFDPIVFAWYKDCTGAFPPTAPPKPPHHGTMGAAAIFFISVAVITVFGCLGGCMFKYSQHNARGAEMIPFIDTWRRWFPSVFESSSLSSSSSSAGSSGTYQVFQSNVGPQAQFDAQPIAATPIGSYGATSYQNM